MTRLFLCFLLLMFSLSIKADFQRAYGLYQQQNYSAAFNQFMDLAKRGHGPSQLYVAKSFELGQGVKQSNQQAYIWYSLAMENNEPEAIEAYKTLRQKLPSKRQAKQEYLVLNEKYGQDALQATLYPEFTANKTTEDIVDQTISTLRFSWKLRNQNAWSLIRFDINELGRAHNITSLVSYPNETMFESVQRAFTELRFNLPVKDGTELGQRNNIIKLIRATDELDDELVAFIAQIEAQTQAGNGSSLFNYSFITQAGLILNQASTNSSQDMLLQAAINDEPAAQVYLAQCLLEGIECKKDLNKAKKWLTLAANNGYRPAQFMLAEQLLISHPKQASNTLKQLALSNYPNAINQYIKHLINGPALDKSQLHYAIKLSQQALLKKPQSPNLLTYLAIAYAEIKRNDLAQQNLLKATRIAEQNNLPTAHLTRLNKQFAL